MYSAEIMKSVTNVCVTIGDSEVREVIRKFGFGQ